MTQKHFFFSARVTEPSITQILHLTIALPTTVQLCPVQLVGFHILQSVTQEASEDGDPSKEDLGDVYKDDTNTGFSNETQIEVERIKDDDSILQNGVEYRQDDATRNQIENQETADKKHKTKKSNFGGLKKGFLL